MSKASRLFIAALLALGYAGGYHVGRSQFKEVEVAETGVGVRDRRRADPSRPPLGFEEDCARSARQFLAWRADGEEWQYACVDAWLARPEVILGR